jgi:hypothetical protein
MLTISIRAGGPVTEIIEFNWISQETCDRSGPTGARRVFECLRLPQQTRHIA